MTRRMSKEARSKNATATLFLLAALVVSTVFFTRFFDTMIATAEAQVATAFASSFREDFRTPDGTTVHVFCMHDTVIATTAITSNQLGVTGGDVATTYAPRCANAANARPLVPLTIGAKGAEEVVAYRYCKNYLLITVTPVITNHFGVGGGSVAVQNDSNQCAR